MNKYQLLKYFTLSLATFARITATYATYTQDYRYETASLISAKINQILVEYGNQTWQQELAQLPLKSISFQETEEGVLVNAI